MSVPQAVIPAVRTPAYLLVIMGVGVLCGIVAVVLAVVDSSGWLAVAFVAIVPSAAAVRALAAGPGSWAKVIETIAVLFGLLLLWRQPDIGMILAVIFLLFPVLAGETYRHFRLLKEGRLRWLALTAVAADQGGRILWVEHASPRGQQTQVLLLDPATEQETSPRSLWGQWPSHIYVCVSGGRRVLASALSGDPEAVDKLAKYEVQQGYPSQN
ncbi:hypothetical protein [Nocardia brasiliensis]|uniref:hypothetical protein n=1 Tax=Nocardia brasiliensis TaxID=37326 RepID=UPI002457FC80|nr:hypothetical protein [Nocardia brasiliensis]